MSEPKATFPYFRSISLRARRVPRRTGRNSPTLPVEEPMTIDEELNHLESQLRRLKIEYEIFFNNPQKRPPSTWSGRC